MQSMPILFAYFSPETILPATSILATVVGIVMMFGKGTIEWIVGGCRRVVLCLVANRLFKGSHFSLKDETGTTRWALFPKATPQVTKEQLK